MFLVMKCFHQNFSWKFSHTLGLNANLSCYGKMVAKEFKSYLTLIYHKSVSAHCIARMKFVWNLTKYQYLNALTKIIKNILLFKIIPFDLAKWFAGLSFNSCLYSEDAIKGLHLDNYYVVSMIAAERPTLNLLLFREGPLKKIKI